MTRPVLPRSLPPMTITSSSRRIFSLARLRSISGSSGTSACPRAFAGAACQGRRSRGVALPHETPRTPAGGDQRAIRGCGDVPEGPLEHLRSKRDDLHEPAVAQLAGHRPEDARPARVVGLVDDHRGVLVEADVRAVVAAEGLLRAHDDRADDLALLDRALRRGLLDGRGDDVPHAGVAALVPADDADAEDLSGAGVVGD